MKRMILLTALFVLVGAFLSANGSAEAEGGKEAVGEQQFKLSISINQPPSSPLYTEGWIPFVEELRDRTDGRVEATLYHSNSLIPIKEAYDGVTNGLADIAYCMPSQSPGRFPLSSFIELPFMGTSSTSASRIANELFDTYPELQEEFKDTHVLFFWAAEPAGISTSKVPVTYRRNPPPPEFPLRSPRGQRVSGYTLSRAPARPSTRRTEETARTPSS